MKRFLCLFLCLWACVTTDVAIGGSPVIWNGDRAKFLPVNGPILGNYTTIDHDGMPNMVKNARAEANTTTGWTAYADAAGTSPADCTGGSPNSTITRSTSSPLEGTASWLLTKNSGDSRQGEGVAYSFSIPTADSTYQTVYGISFDATGSANFDSGDAVLYLYDVTNSALITPTNTTIGNGKFSASFVTTTGTSYRMCIHIASTVDESWTLQTDRIYVGPGQLVQGAPVSSWQSCTMAIANVTTSSSSAYCRRVGDTLDAKGQFTISNAPTDRVLISLPAGMVLDTAKIADTDGYDYPFGDGVFYDNSGGDNYWLTMVQYSTSTTQFQFGYNFNGDDLRFDATHPVNPPASPDVVHWQLHQVPIVGWETGVYLGSGADNSTSYLNWTSVTQTSSTWVSNTTISSKLKRIGDSAYQETLVSLSGAPTSATLTLNPISGITPNVGSFISVGTAYIYDSDTSANRQLGRIYYSGGVFYIDAKGDVTQANPITFASGDTIILRYNYPVTGWTWADYAGKMLAGFGSASATNYGLAPDGVFDVGETKAVSLQPRSTTPSNPSSSSDGRIYLKDGKLIFQYNDGGTVRYKYLDLTGTGVTWTHTTSAP